MTIEEKEAKLKEVLLPAIAALTDVINVFVELATVDGDPNTTPEENMKVLEFNAKNFEEAMKMVMLLYGATPADLGSVLMWVCRRALENTLAHGLKS